MKIRFPLIATLLALIVILPNICRGEVVVPMKIIRGTDYQPYLQVYSVPVECGNVKADFTWGCYGVTQISESFAKKCNVTIHPAEELGTAFVGKGNIPVKFGGQEYNVEANIMKDTECQDSEKNGVIGLDIAKNRQWTLDPEKNTLTLRENGAIPASPLATLDLGDEGNGISLKIKMRNETADIGLMPSSSFFQAAPELQRLWDLGGIVEQDKTALKIFGDVKIMTIHGKDQIELAPNIFEQEVRIALVGDAKHPENTPYAQSGLGQSLLNRWVYTVDEDAKKFYILKRAEPNKPEPATAPSDAGGNVKKK